MSKQEATRLADALGRAFTVYGVFEPSPREKVALEAAALLRRWPDAGEPVAHQYLFDGYNGPVWRNDSGPWNGMQPKDSRPLYTEQPDQSHFAPPGYMDALRTAVEQAPRLPEQSTDDDPPCLTDGPTDAERIAALEAENAALRDDAERWRYVVTHAGWYRHDDGLDRYSQMCVRLPYEADQSCVATRTAAIDAARGKT